MLGTCDSCSRQWFDDVQQSLADGRAGACQVDGREPDRMALYHGGFVHLPAGGWMEQQAFGPIGERISPARLRAEIGIDLIEVSAAAATMERSSASWRPKFSVCISAGDGRTPATPIR